MQEQKKKKESQNKNRDTKDLGYLAPYLARDFRSYCERHPGYDLTKLARDTGLSRTSVVNNLTENRSPSARFLALYAFATDKEITEFFSEIAVIISLQSKNVHLYDEENGAAYAFICAGKDIRRTEAEKEAKEREKKAKPKNAAAGRPTRKK